MEHRPFAPDLVIPSDSNACGNQCAGESAPDVASKELCQEKQVGGPVNCSDSELCTFLQVLGEGYLPTYYSDTNQSVQSKSMSIVSRSYQRGKKTVAFHGFQSLQMSRNLTATYGRALLRSYLADFHARISALPEREPASQVAAPASGKSLPGLLARFDRATCSWKTPQSSLLAASTLFSGTWPRSGSMRNGACYRQPMLAPRTGAIGCGLWPTPTKADGCGGPGNSGQTGGVNLRTAVSIPTPTVHGNYNRAGASPTSGNGLATFVSLFPTPTCNDAKNSTLPPSQKHRDGMAGYLIRSGEPSGWQLNPDWVEWMMNWPIGWSSLEPMPALDWPTWEREPVDVPRVETGIAARVDRLKCIGNGQVPACAAEAWRQLHKRLMEDR